MAFGTPPAPGDVPTGAVGVLARLKIEQGRQEAFEHFVLGFAADVARLEPGCLLYSPQRAIGGDCDYVIFQRFRAWADFEAHADTAHMKAALPHFAHFWDGTPVLEIFTALV
ncbi:MAG: putative quinol monooxygenase [Caulobacterales bacterium]|jgi:quinol monooxygenase YgiN